MKLDADHFLCAIEHITAHGDTDIFPYPFELKFLEDRKEVVAKELSSLALLWQIRIGCGCDEPFTMRAAYGWWPCEDFEDCLPDSWHGRLRRWPGDPFFSLPRP